MHNVKFLIDVDSNPETVFCYFPDALEFGDCRMAYSHIGQHTTATRLYAESCQEATPEQFADLKKEIEALGYKLKVLNKRHVFYIVYNAETLVIQSAYRWMGKEVIEKLTDKALKFMNVTHPKNKELLKQINSINNTNYF